MCERWAREEAATQLVMTTIFGLQQLIKAKQAICYLMNSKRF